MTEQVPDHDLLKAYKERADMHAFGELYRRYAHLVMGMSMKYLKDKDEAHDATAQVFEKLLKELKTAEIQHFKAWLAFVTRNYCISLLRKKGTENERLRDMKHMAKSDMESAGDERPIDREAELEHLEKCLGLLNPEQGECIKLFFIDGLSYAEVAERTGHSLNAVKSHLQNGKRNLKLLIEKNVHIPK